jgi:hypothetical protein
MIGRHPSKRALRAWLGGELGDDADIRVDQHVSTCDRCSNDLEALATAETDSRLRDALLMVLDPPEDLVPRVEAGVAARLESRKMLGYVADVFGAGWETTRLLLTDENEADDR